MIGLIEEPSEDSVTLAADFFQKIFHNGSLPVAGFLTCLAMSTCPVKSFSLLVSVSSAKYRGDRQPWERRPMTKNLAQCTLGNGEVTTGGCSEGMN